MMIEPVLTVEPDTGPNRRLLEALRRLDLEAACVALEQGASADARVRGFFGPERAPVAMLAVKGIYEETAAALPMFRLLIEHLTDPNAADENYGSTLLMAAVDVNDLQSVKRLVEKGADVDSRTTSFFKRADALLIAAMYGGITAQGPSPVIEYLLDNGAEVNVQDERGMTPLMYAAQYGKVEVVRALLARGADPALCNANGHTALWFATRTRQREVVKILRDLPR